MGGRGSGSGHRWNKKDTTGDSIAIAIQDLKHRGVLCPGYRGSLSWTRNGHDRGAIRFEVRKTHLLLRYSYRCREGVEWEAVEQTIPLVRTPCYYGGHRVWFCCPRCERRVAVLYGAGKLFGCRHCYDLTYASQQEYPGFRLLTKVQKIRERLGGSANMLEPFPDKPKGMHWSTYWRWRKIADEVYRQSLGYMSRRLGIDALQ